MKNIKYLSSLLLLSICLCFSLAAKAQTMQWHGVVKSDKLNESIIGASVVVESNNTGTTTNLDGEFSIRANKGDVLVISYIGYSDARVVLREKNELGTIQLSEDVVKLDDVVVVGYGVQKKASSVGSITTTSGSDLLKVGSVNSVSEALQGQMPGVIAINSTAKPGESAADILIRGRSTSGDASPLVLVDGIERDFNDVDVNEVESISVLKDASATAVYGVKGANGVILLTTKRGGNQKTEVSFSQNFGFKLPSAAPEWADYVTSMEQYNKAQVNDKNYGNLIPESTINAWKNAYATGNYGPYNDVFPEVNWWDETVNDIGFKNNTNVNVRGGSDRISYFVSFGHLYDGDIFNTVEQENYDPTFYYRRYNWRSNFDFKITKTTKLSVNIAGSVGIQNEPAFRVGDDAEKSDKFFFSTLLTAPGNEFPIKYSNGVWGDGQSSDQNIIYTMTDGGSRTRKTNKGFYDFALNQNLDFVTKGLSAKASLSYTNSSAWDSSLISGMILGKDELNALRSGIRINRVYDYTNPIHNPDGTISYNYEEKRYPGDNSVGDLPLGGSYDNFAQYSRNLYYELALNYARTFDKHSVSGLFLFNRKMNEWQASKTAMAFPSYEEDWVGRVTYNYKERYLAEFNGAYTGSEKFAPGKRFGFFPSVSVGWRVSEEPWFRNLTKEAVSNLKLRYSYGVVGNDKGASRFNYVQNFDPVGGNAQFGLYNTINYGPLYKEGQLADANATWERSTKQNLGIELGLWGKLNVSLDLFDEKRDNILMGLNTIPSWADSGVAFPKVNLGKTKNHGLEIEVAWRDKISEFNYYVSCNFAASENRVVFNDDPKNQADYLKKEGKSIGYVSKYLTTGNFESLDDIFNSAQSTLTNGKHNTLVAQDLYYIDYNGDGYIDANDMVPMHELNYPLTTLGLTIGGSYKGFGFSMLLYSALDTYKEQLGAYLWDFPGTNIKAQPNTLESGVGISGASKPALHVLNAYNAAASTYSYTDHSYLRLKNIEINYNVPKKVLKPMHITRLQVYANGANLLTFSPADDRRDPELGGQNLYPMVKSYNIGVRIGF